MQRGIAEVEAGRVLQDAIEQVFSGDTGRGVGEIVAETIGFGSDAFLPLPGIYR